MKAILLLSLRGERTYSTVNFLLRVQKWLFGGFQEIFILWLCSDFFRKAGIFETILPFLLLIQIIPYLLDCRLLKFSFYNTMLHVTTMDVVIQQWMTNYSRSYQQPKHNSSHGLCGYQSFSTLVTKTNFFKGGQQEKERDS